MFHALDSFNTTPFSLLLGHSHLLCCVITSSTPSPSPRNQGGRNVKAVRIVPFTPLSLAIFHGRHGVADKHALHRTPTNNSEYPSNPTTLVGSQYQQTFTTYQQCDGSQRQLPHCKVCVSSVA